MNHRPTGRRRRATGLRRLMSADDVVMSVTQRCTPSTSIKNEKKKQDKKPAAVFGVCPRSHTLILSTPRLVFFVSFLFVFLAIWAADPCRPPNPIKVGRFPIEKCLDAIPVAIDNLHPLATSLGRQSPRQPRSPNGWVTTPRGHDPPVGGASDGPPETARFGQHRQRQPR